jgi:hypothetical protein
LLDEFAAIRKQNMAWFKSLNLTEVDLNRKGMHPVLGEGTLKNLLTTLVAYHLTHIAQIARVMANNIRKRWNRPLSFSGYWVFKVVSFLILICILLSKQIKYMRLIILILSLTCSLSARSQQKIVFTNAESGKSVTVKQSNLLKLSFTGYLEQQQTAEGKVSAITDSSVTLSPRKKIFQKLRGAQTVMLKDVTGFKRYSNFRPAGEIIYGILSVGAAGTVTAVIASANVPTALSFLTTAATSTLTLAVKNVFLPTKVKNHLNEGWTMQLLPDN